MTFNKLLQSSEMKMTEFGKCFKIPYRTVQGWKAGLRKCSPYLIELMLYKLEKEKIK